jgi:hypothetical protein
VGVDPATPVKLDLQPYSVVSTSVPVGQISNTLVPVLTYSDGRTYNLGRFMDWTSDAPGVAAPASTPGAFLGVSTGSAVVHATAPWAGGLTDSATIHVF